MFLLKSCKFAFLSVIPAGNLLSRNRSSVPHKRVRKHGGGRAVAHSSPTMIFDRSILYPFGCPDPRCWDLGIAMSGWEFLRSEAWFGAICRNSFLTRTTHPSQTSSRPKTNCLTDGVHATGRQDAGISSLTIEITYPRAPLQRISPPWRTILPEARPLLGLLEPYMAKTSLRPSGPGRLATTASSPHAATFPLSALRISLEKRSASTMTSFLRGVPHPNFVRVGWDPRRTRFPAGGGTIGPSARWTPERIYYRGCVTV